MIYFEFFGPILKNLRCKCVNYERMIHVKKMFDRAKERLETDCDIMEVMD
jgi:hypothetical protein